MSLAATLSAGAAAGTRILGRSAFGWTLAAAVGAGSGYYAGSAGHESGHAEAAPPAVRLQSAPPAASDLKPATLDAPAVVEPQPPAS